MAKRSIASTSLNFGSTYDPRTMRVFSDHVSRLTSEIQLMQQLLSEGTAGQVLTKTSSEDYVGTWATPSGGGGGVVQSVIGTEGEIDVDSSDPSNPVLSLATEVLAGLVLATTALQPSDIGSSVQAYSAVLDAYAAGPIPDSFSLALLELTDAPSWRAAIGAGTSDVTLADPAGSVQVDLTGAVGVATSALRSDAVLILDQSIAPTWTGQHTWDLALRVPDAGVVFKDDLDTYISRLGADNIGITTGGTLRWDVDATRTYQNIQQIIQQTVQPATNVRFIACANDRDASLASDTDGLSVWGWDTGATSGVVPNKGMQLDLAKATSGDSPLGTSASDIGFRFRMGGFQNSGSSVLLSLYAHFMSASGLEIFRVESNRQTLLLPNGAAGTPAVGFINATNSGFRWDAVNSQLTFDVAGTGIVGMRSDRVLIVQPIYGASGSAANPFYTFSTDADNGLYYITTNNFGMTTGGTLRWDINTTRVLQNIQHVISAVGSNSSPSLDLNSTLPAMRWNDSDAGANAKSWVAAASGNQWSMSLVNDAASSSNFALRINRSASSLSSIEFGSSTDNTASAYFSIGAVINSFMSMNGVVTASITADQNNYNPGSLRTSTVLKITTDASRTFTGLTAWNSGGFMLLFNYGSNDLVLAHENASSSSSNRFICPGAVDYTVSPGYGVILWYDSTSSRWRLMLW